MQIRLSVAAQRPCHAGSSAGVPVGYSRTAAGNDVVFAEEAAV
ncbi:MAG TPA: hypothetical protein VK445_11990 [Dissulfurispiraceae bacterium]|nr:hypothetical protein [Dissulfurispiraceae bacterium]